VGAGKLDDLIPSIAASCTATGWTVANRSQWNMLLDTGTNASAGQTVTIAGRVYTFASPVGAADTILIGADGEATLFNLKAAINLEAGAGTLYGAATTLNADVTAASTGLGFINANFRGYLALYTKGTLSLAVSESSSFVWQNTVGFFGNLQEFTSVETAQFQQVHAYIGWDPSGNTDQLAVLINNRDNSAGVMKMMTRAISNGQTYRTISHSAGFHNILVGTYGTRATGFYLQAPYLPGNLTPCKITDATNATPIVMTTSAAHGYVTGDTVFQKYITGNTAANGVFTITVITPTTYSLATSVGSGTFTGTKGLVRNLTPPRIQIMESVLSNFQNTLNDSWEVNPLFYFGISSGQGAFFGVADGAPYDNGSPNYEGFFPRAMYQNSAGTYVDYAWASGAFISLEPFLCYTSAYGGSVAGPQLFNMAVVQASVIPGGATTTFDGHTWFGLYNNAGRHEVVIATA
jgi:hypothetical protein